MNKRSEFNSITKMKPSLQNSLIIILWILSCIFLQFCANSTPSPSAPVIMITPSNTGQAAELEKDWYNRPLDTTHSTKTAQDALEVLKKIALDTQIHHKSFVANQFEMPLSFSEEVEKAYQHNPDKTLEYIIIILLEAKLDTECGFYVDASASNMKIRQAYRQKMDSLMLDSLMRRHHYFAYYLCLHTFKQKMMMYMISESHLTVDWLLLEAIKQNTYLRKSMHIRKRLKRLKAKKC